MQKKNYRQEMLRQLETIPAGEALLLHSCCGPCSSAVLEQLAAHFAVTLHYYNPNIWPPEEYARRRDEQKALLESLPVQYPVVFTEAEYDHGVFTAVAAGLENEPERGARCTECFRLRLDAAAAETKRRGIPWFTTTLTVSPHKNAALLNGLGAELAQKYGVSFLASDFKKAEGYKRSLTLSQQYGLYRQEYCGCEFSMRDNEE